MRVDKGDKLLENNRELKQIKTDYIDYITKRASKRLYSLRILKKVGVDRDGILIVIPDSSKTYIRIRRASLARYS